MKKLWYIIGFVSAGLIYYILKYVIFKKKQNKSNGMILKYLDTITVKNKKKLDIMYKKIVNLDKKKAKYETFDGFSITQLLDYIHYKLKIND